MPIEIDRKNPFKSLEALGATYTHSEVSDGTTITIAGVDVSTNEYDTVRYDWTLPKAAGFVAAFVPEKFSSQIIKLFKSELQVGDYEFDATVYITTPDQAKVAAFLASDRIRKAIHGVVQFGGTIGIEGNKVSYQIVGETVDSDFVEMANLIAALLE